MQLHEVKVHPSKALLKREDQLAWKMAGVATDKVAVQKDVAEMIINRVIDNAAVAIASVNRRPVVSARGMALGHAKKGSGATVFGMPSSATVSPEWAAEHVQISGCVQGNLAPEHMVTGGAALVRETRRVVDAFKGGAHIFNLGHGITPDADPDNVSRMIEAVRG